jgi:hypothetical protein
MAPPLRLHDLFSAALAQSHFAEIPPPVPGATLAWQRRYRVLTVGMRGMGVGGTVALTRRPAEGNAFELALDYQKNAVPNYRNVLQATILCAGDLLGTPQSWRFASRTRDLKAEALEDASTWGQSATRVDSGYRLADSTGERLLPVAGPATLNWVLPAVLGRLPKEPGPAIPFTLLDDFDLVKPGMELRCRGTRDIVVGGKQILVEEETALERGRVFRPSRVWAGGQDTQITRYDLTGPGLVPRAYYVDAAGRLVLMVAGSEGLCLEADGPAPEQEGK